jgi:DNA-binding transcriptional LysR family regulator
MSDLEWLIRFVAVAEELSFNRAAKRLRVDQPWLSRQIQQLEAQMGCPLLVRSTRKVTLTSEGMALLKSARELSEAAERARTAMRDVGRIHSSVISLGGSPYAFWMPGRRLLIERFQARYPRATLELVSNYTPRLLTKLRKRTLDTAILPAVYDLSDMEQMVIHRSRPSLLIPSENALAAQASVSLADLQGQRVALTDPRLNPVVHERFMGPFLAAGAIPVVIAEGQQAIGYYAKQDRLIVVSQGWPDSDPAIPSDFTHVPISGPAPDTEFVLMRRREPSRALLNHFWNLAKDVAAEIVGEKAAA